MVQGFGFVFFFLFRVSVSCFGGRCFVFCFVLSAYRHPIVPAPFLEKTILSPLSCLDIFVETNWPYMGGPFLDSVLFHWSTCLFFFRHHVVFITEPLQQASESGSRSPWTSHFGLSSFFEDVLAIPVPSLFHVHLRISVSISINKPEERVTHQRSLSDGHRSQLLLQSFLTNPSSRSDRTEWHYFGRRYEAGSGQRSGILDLGTLGRKPTLSSVAEPLPYLFRAGKVTGYFLEQTTRSGKLR